jgi:23S rRNA (pseudouridine1915-N3)-methyltransferase
MKLILVAFGKMKTPGLAESAEYYARLLRPWVQTEVIELKPLPVTDKSAASRSKIQAKESELLIAKLDGLLGSRGAFFLLDETGSAQTTLKWADQVRKWEGESLPAIALCIGSSLGFSDDLKRRARGKFSLGPQTLPHELARVVLLEQLYRAWSVTRGHPYHVEA